MGLVKASHRLHGFINYGKQDVLKKVEGTTHPTNFGPFRVARMCEDAQGPTLQTNTLPDRREVLLD